MPSSKPEFSDFGIDWQTDWEVEVSKQVFATAFGVTAKPMEGDLIYIPLMKRMWMLSGAYEEKKDAFMWNATTFKLTLVKYQEKDSVDLGDTEALVNTLVKNKYEDLFGDQESLGSGFDEANNETQYMGKLYNVYEQDAVRKSLAVSSLNINSNTLYFKGNIICDSEYIFDGLEKCHEIEYQQKFCGENGTLSFIINSKSHKFESELISIGNLRLIITQSKSNTVLKCLNTNKSLELENDNSYLIYLRWSKQLNIIELASAIYTYNKTVPVYKLQPANYWFDIDNKVSVVEKYNREINVPNKSSVIIWNFNGTITNIKLFDEYISDEKEILQMYPTNNHLLINDTARKITALGGSNIS
jgi:hypothetical protein